MMKPSCLRKCLLISDVEIWSRLRKCVGTQDRCGGQLLWKAGDFSMILTMIPPILEEEKAVVEGNPNRDIWKLMAWQMAEDKRVPIYSRATFAALSGHLSTLLAVSTLGKTLLWAYLRVIVEIRVEKEIRNISLHQYVPLPETYWSN
ncbi:hypothetical protein L9F63_026456, partial [Diploptera punctata]